MITSGWVSKYSCVFVFVVSLLFTNTIVNAQASAVTTTEPQTENISLSSVFDLSKAFVQSFANLNYYTTQDVTLDIPGTTYQLIINWGFGGSGDTLSPLPAAKVSIQNTNTKAANVNAFNIVELGKIILQEELKKQTKQLSFLRWVSENTLNPTKLFCIKLLILLSNYKQNLLNGNQLGTEIFRLMIRLGLVENLSIVNPAKTFSSYLPEIIVDVIKNTIPEAIGFIDAAWTGLTTQDSTSLEFPLTVHACLIHGSDIVANRYFDVVKQGSGEDFANGMDIVTFSNVTTQNTPKDMPQELKDAALKNVKKFIKIRIDEDKTWIAYVTDELGILDAARLSLASTLKTVKQYIAARKEFFKNNPLIEQQYTEQLNETQKQQRRMYAFIQTDAGKASTQRLADRIQEIEGETKTSPEKTKKIKLNASLVRTIQELEQELARLQKEKNMLTASISQTQINAKNASIPQSVVQKIVDAYTKDLNALEVQIKDLTEKIDTLRARLSHDTVTAITNPNTIENQLHKLHTFVAMLKQNGEVVPSDILKRIAELETQIQPSTEVVVASSDDTFENNITIRERIAQAYEAEAKQLTNDCQAIKSALSTINDPVEQEIAAYSFLMLEQPQYTAYIKHLESKVKTIREQNKKAAELKAYRKTFAQTKKADIPTDLKKEINDLEATVGWLCNNQKNEGVLASIINNTPEIKHFINDMQSDNAEYAKVKTILMNDLFNIFRKVSNLKEYAELYRYIIANIMPTFLPTFEQLVNA
jgi:hypothetical protein